MSLLSQLHYMSQVLGIRNILNPLSFQNQYSVYGSLNSRYLMCFFEDYQEEQRQLLSRMMKALRAPSYGCVSAQLSCSEILIQNLIIRSSADKVIFFGGEWKEFLRKLGVNPFSMNRPFPLKEEVSVSCFWTYPLRDFLGSSEDVRKRKLEVFQALKNF